MSALSNEASELVAAARAGGAPSVDAVARMRTAIAGRVAAGDVFDADRVPPPNGAAAIARGAWLKWLGGVLLVTTLGTGGPRGASARPFTSNAPVVATIAPPVVTRAVSTIEPPTRAVSAAVIEPHASAIRPHRAARTIMRVDAPRAAQRATPPTTAADSIVPSDAMSTALRLYARERWAEAAVQFQRVVEGATSDEPANVQRAQFHLARALEHLGLHQAALDVFDEIVQRGAEHAYFAQTLPWLASLSQSLPEPAGIARRVGAYDVRYIDAFDHDDTRSLHDELLYLLGRARYDEARLDEAIALFRRIHAGSRYYARARFFQGVASVRAHHAQPAADAFREVLAAIEIGVANIDERDRMRDLAWLELARLYYATSHLESAIDSWDHIHVDSEYWLDAEFEEAWAYLRAGDGGRALGNIHTLQSPYFERFFYPESIVLRGVIHFSNCQYDDAEAAMALFHARYDALRPALGRYLAAHDAPDSAAELVRDARDAEHRLPRVIVALANSAVGDRSVRRHLEYVDRIDDEQRLLRALPTELREGSLGARILAGDAVARSFALEGAADLVRARYRRAAEELRDLENQATSISIEILDAHRAELALEAQGAHIPPGGVHEPEIVAVDQWEDGLLWPYQGEWWQDELGTYRQRVRSRCTR